MINFKIGDFVAFINRTKEEKFSQWYLVQETSPDKVMLSGKWYDNDIIELFDDQEPKEKLVSANPYVWTSPVYPKTVYARLDDSHETYDTEKEAMIAHFDEEIKSLVLFRGNFNISTVIENLDQLISKLDMMKSFNIERME